MSAAAARAARVRQGAGWFALDGRGLILVCGADRVRWSNGMLSNDVSVLAPGPERSGCHALLLTNQGRIVADLHVWCREDALWLELEAAAAADVRERLERFVIADDVTLRDASQQWRRFALEGPAAPEILGRAVGAPVDLAPESGVDLSIAGAMVGVWAWGWSGEPAYQLFVPPEAAEAVEEAIVACGDSELVIGDPDTLEVLRIEAGTPRQGAELGEDVLPAEARLVGGAARLDKGCYTGQEIVARMASRDAVGHLLVGLHFDADDRPPGVGAEVRVEEQKVGELTSACVSEAAGPIGLGYVRRAHSETGTPVTVGGHPARVAELPFVAPSR